MCSWLWWLSPFYNIQQKLQTYFSTSMHLHTNTMCREQQQQYVYACVMRYYLWSLLSQMSSVIAMATMALQSGSHVLSFIPNSAMTQCLSGFSAKKVCSEELLRDPEITKVPLNKNIKRNLLVLCPPTQSRQSLCLFISDLFFSRSLFDSSFFFLKPFSLCAPSLLHMTLLWSIYTYCTPSSCCFIFNGKVLPGGLSNITVFHSAWAEKAQKSN